MSILVLGAYGQIGVSLIKVLENNNYKIFKPRRSDLDICNGVLIKKYIQKIKPHTIINCAAYTDVDKSEKNMDECLRVNFSAVETISKICSKENIALIHISSDYVFDGNSRIPYEEDHIENPINFYGKSKLLAEQAIKKNMKNYLILRTSWVFGQNGKNFLKTMIDLASNKKQIQIIDDQIGSPTYSDDIALTLKKIIYDKINGAFLPGTYNYCGAPATSWYEFAKEIIEFGFDNKMMNNLPKIIPITSDQYPSLAARPKFSVLDCTKIKKLYDVSQPSWKQGIRSSLLLIRSSKL